MMAASKTAQLDAARLQVQPEAPAPNIVTLESGRESHRRRKIDRWFAIGMIVIVAVFAGTFIALTLNPALKTLATSALHWTPEGP